MVQCGIDSGRSPASYPETRYEKIKSEVRARRGSGLGDYIYLGAIVSGVEESEETRGKL